MNLNELKAALVAAPASSPIAIVLPDGGRVPAHFHVTEVGHVRKDFIDCGGKSRATRSCVLQTWTASDRDDGHRLDAGRLGKILGLAASLFTDDALPVEVEYEDGVISQFPLGAAALEGGTLVLQLGTKHTDCLAKEKCGCEPVAATAGVESSGSGCCSSAPTGTGRATACC